MTPPRLIEAFDPEMAMICETALRQIASNVPLPGAAELRLRMAADLLFHAHRIHARTTGLSLAINVNNLPELMATMRAEMAALLRGASAGQDPRTVAKLNELAAAFEVGQTV